MPLNETPLTLMGSKTPRAVIYKTESHKLCQAFNVKVTDSVQATIVKGQPVKLETDGTISPYTGTGIYLGIAITDTINPAYRAQKDFPIEVTVLMEGFAVVNWVAAADNQTAGYVATDGTLVNNRYVKAAASVDQSSAVVPTNFIALNGGDEGDIIQVLIK